MTDSAAAAFHCTSFEIDGAELRLHYAAGAHAFTERIVLPGSLAPFPAPTVTSLVRLLWLAAAPSYFKAFAPTEFHVDGGLTARERAFVTALLRRGLGEFSYVNDLPEVLATAVVAPDLPDDAGALPAVWEPERALVAVGGGKDSVVTLEALRQGLDVTLFSVNRYAPIEATAATAELDLVHAARTLDPHLMELNAAGAPNGHVPVTAVNSLLAVLSALVLEIDTVVFSNEASSSFGNTTWHGVEINHQWSKSLEFEQLLRASLPDGSPQYVSLLRPLTELRIMRRFASLPQYHAVFTSCNRAFKLDESQRTSWCRNCPKCRFVFLTLAPFVSRAELLGIFSGRDLFADPAQEEGFLELLGAPDRIKPLECVGEPDETRVALTLLTQHPDWKDHPFLARPEIAAMTVDPAAATPVFAFRDGRHCLPPMLVDVARAI